MSKARGFVLLSDLHAHAWSAFAQGDGAQNTRLRRSLTILDESLRMARSLKVPWVFAGDIVHTAGYTLNVVMAELTAVFAQYPDVVKLAVWGNHDARGIGGRIRLEQTVLATLACTAPRFFVLDPSIDPTPYVAESGLTFSGAGYQPTADALSLAVPADVGIYHQTVRGTKAPGGFVLEEGVDGDALLDQHRVVLVGHVHHPQLRRATRAPQFYDGAQTGQLLIIPGSPEHHNFGDEGQHGWWVVSVPELRGSPVVADFMPGGSPEFRTVDTPADVRRDGHFYRVRMVPAGMVAPDDVAVVAPAPTAIESRDVLRGAHGEQTVDLWLRESPPDGVVPVERYREVGCELLQAHEMVQLLPLRLASVRMHNFCSYADAELAVTPGMWLVMGKGRNFPSNGAGKTTLFESVFWALFGRTTKGQTGDEVIRWGESECEVEVEFRGETLDEGLRVIRRRGKTKLPGLEVQLSSGPITGATTSEITAKLAAYLGITPELYQALGYFSQERLLLFASATDGERKEMLADLIGLSEYQEAAKAAERRRATCAQEEQRAGAVLEATHARVENEKQRRAQLERESAEWARVHDDRVREAKAELSECMDTLPQVREQKKAELRAALGGRLDQREATVIEQLGKLRVALEAHVAAGEPEATADEEAAVRREVTEAMADMQTLHALRDRHLVMLAEQDRLLATQQATLAKGECPSCGQAVTPEHQARCLAPLREAVERVQRELDSLKSRHAAAIQRGADLQRRLLDVQAGVRRAEYRQQLTRQIDATLREQGAIVHEREALEKAVDGQVQAEVDKMLARHNDWLQRVLAEQNPHASALAGTGEREAEAVAEVARLTTERERLAGEIAVMEYWRDGFSKQGLQSLLVDEIATQFNAARGAIFPTLTQGVYDVQFSTVSQTKGGEARERTEFHVYEHGQLVPYAALSGGQRRRVDVGVMLTLIMAVSRWLQVPGMLGMLVLDEVLGFLDASGAEGLLEVLREVQEQIPAIFVVSHEAHVQGLFPAVISVEQDAAGVSRLVTGSTVE